MATTKNKIKTLLDDIEYSLNEAPYGAMSQGWNKLKTKIGGDMGAHAQGALDLGTKANRLHRDFMKWAGFNSVNASAPTKSDVHSFLVSKGLTNQTFSKIQDEAGQDMTVWDNSSDTVDKALMKDTLTKVVRLVAKKGAAGAAGAGGGQPPAGSGQPPAAGGGQPPAGSGVPPDWANWVNSLTSEQKAEALRTLQRAAGIPPSPPQP